MTKSLRVKKLPPLGLPVDTLIRPASLLAKIGHMVCAGCMAYTRVEFHLTLAHLAIVGSIRGHPRPPPHYWTTGPAGLSPAPPPSCFLKWNTEGTRSLSYVYSTQIQQDTLCRNTVCTTVGYYFISLLSLNIGTVCLRTLHGSSCDIIFTTLHRSLCHTTCRTLHGYPCYIIFTALHGSPVILLYLNNFAWFALSYY